MIDVKEVIKIVEAEVVARKISKLECARVVGCSAPTWYRKLESKDWSAVELFAMINYLGLWDRVCKYVMWATYVPKSK